MKKNILFLLGVIFIALIIFLGRHFLSSSFSGDFFSGANEWKGNDLIQIQNISPNQKITSPLLINGVARGSWFFEAVFPVKIVAEDGTLIASGIAKADADWKTDVFVPFHVQLIFTSIGHTSGNIVFQKDNPSGISQNDREFTISVNF